MSNLLIIFSHKTQGLFQDDSGLPKSSPRYLGYSVWNIYKKGEFKNGEGGGFCVVVHTRCGGGQSLRLLTSSDSSDSP